jgi:hypothetical protein
MSQCARVGDIGSGQCSAGHPGVPVGIPVAYITTYISGCSTVFTNYMAQTVIGSVGATDCGHTTTAVSGSSTVFAENMAVHRIGDIDVINEGPGDDVCIVGSDNVDNNA